MNLLLENYQTHIQVKQKNNILNEWVKIYNFMKII